MKTFQLKFKTLFFLFAIGLAFASCRNGKDGDEKDLDSDSKLEQVNPSSEDGNPTRSNSSQDTNTSITEDPDATSPDSPEGNEAPVTLDCNYFQKNPNTILKDNLKAKVDYIITCWTKIDGKLSIDPGVVIAFDQDAGIEFKDKSSFKMNGTAAKPIVLTGKEKTKGFWKGIYSVSSNPSNIMNYVTIDYAGGSGSIAALRIYRENSIINLDHCTFSNSKTSGAAIKDKVGKDTRNIVMTNSTFTKNNIPFETHATRLRIFDGTNSFSGNEKDYIHLDGGTLYGDATWSKIDVPYFLQSNFKFEDGVLTVAPGTQIIMPAQSWLHLSNKASLKMVGTAEDPIVIRGEHDVPGFWQQLNIDSSSPLNEIGHAIFKNAGKTTKKPNGAIFLGREKFLNIHDVVFSNCYEYGLSIQDVSKSHFEHDNLTLDNTPKLFSDFNGKTLDLADADKS